MWIKQVKENTYIESINELLIQRFYIYNMLKNIQNYKSNQ